MIKRENRVVITFHTTTEAMEMEELCKQIGADGRMIPVPGFISAGCGLAWCAKPESETMLRKVMQDNKITYQKIQVCLI